MSYSEPITKEVLANLDAKRAAELKQWYSAHHEIFDLRIHSIFSCPFISYLLPYYTMKHNSKEWALKLYSLFKAKHEEEGHCNCDKILKLLGY